MATRRVTIVRVDAKLAWEVRRYQDGDWLAICDPLGLTLQAETWANLMEDISLTLDAMLRDLLKSNDLDQFLKERKWKLLGPIPQTRGDIRFDVPFFPMKMGPHGSTGKVYQ
jgi:hypothetical protein